MADTLTVPTKTVPTTKAELLAYTEERWQALASFTDALSEAEWTAPTDARGWSVKDHVAHIVTWVRAEVALLRYRTPLPLSAGMPDALWKSGDFDKMNEHVRQLTIADSPAAVREERDRVFHKLVEVVSRFSDDDLARPANDFGLEEPGKSLLAVLTEYHGDHFAEHRGYVERIVAQG
jgi:hypothetical protein